MPRGKSYGRRRLPAGQMVQYRGRAVSVSQLRSYAYRRNVSLPVQALMFGVRHANTVADAYAAASQYFKGLQAIRAGMKGHSMPRPLKQTKAVPRIRKGGRRFGTSSGSGIDKRGQLKGASGNPLNKGKGFNTKRNGVIVTHPRSVVPKWKLQRLRNYKYSVYQTVLLSKSNRMPASNNTLEGCRYPIKLPDAASERIQTLLFTPFCAHFSGTHTTLARKVNSAKTDLDHYTDYPFDVIQNKASLTVHTSNSGMIEGNVQPDFIRYEGSYGIADETTVTAAYARSDATQLKAMKAHIDQLVKQIKVDLVFTSSRAFPVEASVSVVRMIEPTTPFGTLDTSDKQELCNSLDNKGLDWKRFKTEWLHTFTIPALKLNKRPARLSIKKVLKCNFMQTNSFNQNTVSEDMAEAAQTELGRNIHSHLSEIADGNMSSQFFVLIKYRKRCVPQQFEYKQVIESHADNVANCSITLPVVTEESFDVPALDGNATTAQIPGGGDESVSGNDGSPLSTDQGDESKASAYLVGKLVYEWGFRKETESIPSMVSSYAPSTDYKKPQSLMIDPTYTSDDTYGIYTQSPHHVQIAADTSE